MHVLQGPQLDLWSSPGAAAHPPEAAASSIAVRAAPGRSPREEGGRLGELCADKQDPDFRERAAAFVLAYLKRYGATSGEVLTSMAIASGLAPTDARAFGPVFAKLSRRRQIVCTGFCTRTKGHGTAGGRVWGLA